MTGVQPGRATKTDAAAPESALARKLHYYMQLQREVEDRIERKLYRQGKIVGGVYVGRGQEAICIGVGVVAAPDDVLFPCHRDLGLYFIRGVHPRQVFAQYMGREGGLTRGRDGNMHMGDMRLRIVAIISAMAASVPVAVGSATAPPAAEIGTKASTWRQCSVPRLSSSAITTSSRTLRHWINRWRAPTSPIVRQDTVFRRKLSTATTCWQSTKPHAEEQHMLAKA
jgi:hypothetical protein